MMTENYDTNIVPIGRKAPAGRGNSKTTPNAAARSLAGSSPARKKPASRAPSGSADANPEASVGNSISSKPESPKQKPTVKKTAAKKKVAKKAATKKAAADSSSNVRPISSARKQQESASGENPPEISIGDAVSAMVDRTEEILSDDIQSRLAEILAMIRHRLAGEFEVDEFGLDKEFVRALVSTTGPIIEKWFRLQVRGVENIPKDGGALLVSNHSGTIPIDSLVTGYVINQYADRFARPLAADLMFSLPFFGQLSRKMGATLACTEDAERLLSNGEIAAVWPEGFKGVGKPYSQRYKLQRFGRGGFVASAVRAQVPIIPVSIVGAEEIYPLVGNVPGLARILGLPYLPITPLFPWLGPLGMVPLPSKWIIEFGEPIRTDAYEPSAADDPMLLFELTDQVRESIQQTLYALLVERGNPFL